MKKMVMLKRIRIIFFNRYGYYPFCTVCGKEIKDNDVFIRLNYVNKNNHYCLKCSEKVGIK